MNTTIGYWTDESQKIKSQLVQFMLGEMANKIPQIGSLHYKKECKNHPRLWEYATAVTLSNLNKSTVLDVGGLNNLLGWYVHDVCKCTVVQNGLNAQDQLDFKNNCGERENLRIKAVCEDMRKATYENEFDIVYCINVIEHIREVARKERPTAHWKPGLTHYWDFKMQADWDYESEQEKVFVKSIAKAVKPGGLVVITFDFNNIGGWRKQIKCAYMRHIQDVIDRIVKPSGLKVIGDIDYETEHKVDCHPAASTGIIVLEK